MGKCNGSTEEPVLLCPRGVRESFPGLEAFNLGLWRMNRSLPNRDMEEGLFNEHRHGGVHETASRLISSSRAHILHVRQKANMSGKE